MRSQATLDPPFLPHWAAAIQGELTCPYPMLAAFPTDHCHELLCSCLRNSYIPSYYLQFLVELRASGNEGMAGVPSFLVYFAPGVNSSPLLILKALLT